MPPNAPPPVSSPTLLPPTPWLPPILNNKQLTWISLVVRSQKILTTMVAFPVDVQSYQYACFVLDLMKDCEKHPEVIHERAAFARSVAAASEIASSTTPLESIKTEDATAISNGSPHTSAGSYAPRVIDGLTRAAHIAILFYQKSTTLSAEQRITFRTQYYATLDTLKHQIATAQPSAARWHMERRAAMLRTYPAIKALHKASDHALIGVLTTAISVGHVYTATYIVGQHSTTVDLLLSATIGAFFAFGFQAMNHILMHSKIPFPKVYGLMSSSCGIIPWFSYYHAGGHARHHINAGTESDIDREALFWIWERAPHPKLDNPVGSVLWVSAAAMGLPLAYMYSLFVCAFYNWKNNKVELAHFLVETSTTILLFTWICLHTASGKASLLYLALSGAYSMGFLCHPYLGFWILQHVCAFDPATPSRSQPTISYYGSSLWNYANYNILLHVEHHDFSRIPFHKVHQLRTIAPEFYTELRFSASILRLIKDWVCAKGDKMDFACEHVFGQDYVRNI